MKIYKDFILLPSLFLFYFFTLGHKIGDLFFPLYLNNLLLNINKILKIYFIAMFCLEKPREK